MQSFREYIEEKQKPFEIKVAEQVIARILKKYKLQEDVSVTFTDRLQVYFNKPCSIKKGKKFQDELNKAGLTAIFEKE